MIQALSHSSSGTLASRGCDVRVELWPQVFTQQHPQQGRREKESTVFLCQIDLVFICQEYLTILVLHFDYVD